MDLNTASPTCLPTREYDETSFVSPSKLFVSSSQVKKQLERMSQNKAAGPDGVCPSAL